MCFITFRSCQVDGTGTVLLYELILIRCERENLQPAEFPQFPENTADSLVSVLFPYWKSDSIGYPYDYCSSQ